MTVTRRALLKGVVAAGTVATLGLPVASASARER